MKLSLKEARRLGLPLDGPHIKTKLESANLWNGTGPEVRKPKPKVDKSHALFNAACTAHGLPLPEPEYPFHPTRKWRFDYLFDFVAVEIVGGIWKGGHHSRGQDQIDDMEKFNEAQILGFVVIQVTPQQVESGAVFDLVKRALGSEGEQP